MYATVANSQNTTLTGNFAFKESGIEELSEFDLMLIGGGIDLNAAFRAGVNGAWAGAIGGATGGGVAALLTGGALGPAIGVGFIAGGVGGFVVGFGGSLLS